MIHFGQWPIVSIALVRDCVADVATSWNSLENSVCIVLAVDVLYMWIGSGSPRPYISWGECSMSGVIFVGRWNGFRARFLMVCVRRSSCERLCRWLAWYPIDPLVIEVL